MSTPTTAPVRSERLAERARRLGRRTPGVRRLLPPPALRIVSPGTPTPRVAILGAGFSGLGMAIRLRQSGIETFTVFEKADRLGGTWRDNTYPGAACDVPSHLYCYSFEPKPDWDRKFAEQPEILDYLEHCADRYRLHERIRFGTEIAAVEWDDEATCWRLRTTAGEQHEADIVVAGTGQLNRPFVPEIPGLEAFEGTSFHSARWNHDHDLAGARVAVIGNGASAVQFVPHVAEQAERLTIFQRSANYIAPKPDREFTAREKWLFAHVPGLERLYRWSIYLRFEARFFLFRRGSRVGRMVGRRFEEGLGPLASDALPRPALIPDYPVGCKRILISNDYYPALVRPDVEVTTDPIERVTPDGIVTEDGRHHPADTIIFGTGFEATRFLGPIQVSGVDGQKLADVWDDGAEAHLGMTVAGFPNFFLLYGPNTNLGHNSILIMVERQIEYVLSCLEEMIEHDIAALDVRPDVMERSNRRLQSDLRRTVWADQCRSWYKTASGKITQNWSGFTFQYWKQTRRPRMSDFVPRRRA